MGVDTTRAWRHKNGEVSARADRSRGRPAGRGESAAAARGGGAPAGSGDRSRDRANLLRGHQAALQAWSAAGADLVLGGHIHLPYTLAPHGSGAATLGATGGNRRLVAHTRRGAQLGEHLALGRAIRSARSHRRSADRRRQALPGRAVGLRAPRSQLRPQDGHARATGTQLSARRQSTLGQAALELASRRRPPRPSAGPNSGSERVHCAAARSPTVRETEAPHRSPTVKPSGRIPPPCRPPPSPPRAPAREEARGPAPPRRSRRAGGLRLPRRRAAGAPRRAVTLNPVVVTGAPPPPRASTCPTRLIRWTCAPTRPATSA